MRRNRAKRKRSRRTKALKPVSVDVIEPDSRKRLAECVSVGLLVALGLIYSLHFLGHFVVPKSDFIAFLDTGQEWLQFQIPSSMKRAPLFSIITVLVGKFFTGPERYLFGTELYNAIMLPIAMVLIYFVGRGFLGKAAIWVALLAGISPHVVHMSSQPLSELTLLALFAATVLCVRSHIHWAYLFAMLGSVARWDLAPLIPAVALVDLIRNRKWLKTIILTFLASIPFGLCMIITAIQLRVETGGAHYLKVLSEDRVFELFADLQLYWQNICSFLNAQLVYSLPFDQVRSFEGLDSVVFWSTVVLLVAAFLAGSVAAIIRKRWEIVVMLIGAAPYIIVHMLYPFRRSRYCVPVGWIGLVIAAYGAIVFWQWFRSEPKRKVLVLALQLAGAIAFVLWAIKIAETLTHIEGQCPVIKRLVVISSVFVVAGFFMLQLVRRLRPSMRWLVVPAFLVLAVVSNATTTGALMGDGQRWANFKRLGQWFLENAGVEDRMMTTMSVFMPIYTGLPKERFAHTGSIELEAAEDFPAFVQECRQRGITLIAWDSKLFGKRDDLYYKLWGLDRVEILAAPLVDHRVRKVGPCELVHVMREGSPKIAIYRIMDAQME